jgi:hypothetical protein
MDWCLIEEPSKNSYSMMSDLDAYAGFLEVATSCGGRPSRRTSISVKARDDLAPARSRATSFGCRAPRAVCRSCD